MNCLQLFYDLKLTVFDFDELMKVVEMGRAKLEMKLIMKEKSRNTTYKKRKEGLVRKLHEFTTLCDVKACMIIYGPQGATQPEIFPQNSDHVRRIIDIYKSKNKDSIKSYGIRDFFHDREKRSDEELSKLRKKNLESKYPTRPDLLNIATEAQLREFGILLSSKLDHVKSTIELLRRNKQSAAASMDSRLTSSSQSQSQSHGASSLFEVMNHHHHHHHHPLEMHLPYIDHPNSMMMLLMNDRASTSANIQLQRQVFFDSAAAPRPLLARYFAPPLPPPQPYMLSAVVPPQLLFSNRDTVQEDFIQYEMKNQIAPSNQN